MQTTIPKAMTTPNPTQMTTKDEEQLEQVARAAGVSVETLASLEAQPQAQQAHTPGPWRVDGKRISSEAQGYSIAKAYGSNAEADARLIAAAPALLAALKETQWRIEVLTMEGSSDRQYLKVVETIAQAAIAAAEGQS